MTSAFWCLVALVAAQFDAVTYGAPVDSMTFVRELSISDMHVTNGRITSETVKGRERCFAECFMDIRCVTVAYSLTTEACQMYMYDLQDYTENTIPQSGTIFFKAICDNPEYTYVRNLSLCIKRHDTPMNHTEAASTCESENATMMWMDTAKKQLYFKNTLPNVHASDTLYWLGGLGNSNDTSDWDWYNTLGETEAIDVDNGGVYWYIDEPVDAGCLTISSKKVMLHSKDCVELYGVICTQSPDST